MYRVVALFVDNVKRDTSLAMPYLGPVIEERQRALAELGEGWDDKPASKSLLYEAQSPLTAEYRTTFCSSCWTSRQPGTNPHSFLPSDC